jgi:(1->4)-alpha-D-glucan 1-alpha-D-glucosylmutase
VKPEPRATYRVQLRPGFGFAEAADLASYLHDLGVSHLYASPYLQAAAGSTHGYDVVDPTRVNAELGGDEGHARLCDALREHGLGQLLDLVPNHMAIVGRENPWWWDVLQNGPASRYATFFDVDWDASGERWPNKMLLPVLGDHYGRVLEDGLLQLTHHDGEFVLHYHEHVFPLDPSSLAGVLGQAADHCGVELLAFLAESHHRLPRPAVTARQLIERRHRDVAVLAELRGRICREQPAVAAAIDAEVDRLNRDPDALDALLEQQPYRLALWRTASRDLGYRRFFDIKDLAGLRVEDIEVLHASHALPLGWVREGLVQGLRIDHPDGLRDPGEYFQRLREACPDAWLLAEKILMPDEELPDSWPVAGTTGYDFLNLAGGLFVDPAAAEPLARTYADLTGEPTDFPAIVVESKRQVLTDLLGSELNRLASLFVDVCERHRRHRDYTRHQLREALLETAVAFPVYRSYVAAARDQTSDDDARRIGQAIARAGEARPDLDPELLRFLESILLLRVPGDLEGELAMRFQQLTSAAMAKGWEDTALYRYLRLVALNEVGGDPDRFGVSPATFHATCARNQAERPFAMLASTTHDTKRSEDVRARLAVLSEIPERWAATVREWVAHNARHRRDDRLDRNTEYLLYQTLVGAWPLAAERATAYMEKAVREAKRHTAWTAQDPDYEAAVREFTLAVLDDPVFTASLERFVAEVREPGHVNGLAQTLLKLTAPGVPDIYQGTELWDLSLVDPDNRRPVDFARRRALLDELDTLSPADILDRMDEGLPKLWLVRQTLHLRRREPELFGADGAYRPLAATGRRADHVVAYQRGDGAVAVAPRLSTRMADGWGDTALALPARPWRNLLTGDDLIGGDTPLSELLARFPVALLARKDRST